MPYYRDLYIYRSFLYLTSLIQFYIFSAFALTVCKIKTYSAVVNHPDRLFPTQIASPSNLTIHSFKANWAMINYLLVNYSLPPITRRWAAPWYVQTRLAAAHTDLRPITLRGRLMGPKLRQGRFFIQRHHVIMIAEEVGRWPSQQNHVATVALNLTTGNTFTLLIPLSYMDTTSVREDIVIASEPFFLHQAIDYYVYFTQIRLPQVPSPTVR